MKNNTKDNDNNFRKYVALELGNLHHDCSKKILKNGIRKLIARMVDEDDLLSSSIFTGIISGSAFLISFPDNTIYTNYNQLFMIPKNFIRLTFL